MNTRLNHLKDWLPLVWKANWSIAKLAKLCNVSPRTMERHFLKYFGKTPKVWLTKQREIQALELLCEGLSVKETASKLGYRNANTFSREFKKMTGQCPRAMAAIPILLAMEKQPANVEIQKVAENVA